MGFILVFMTASNEAKAAGIIHHLLERRLIACGNIISNVQSQYWWKGRIEEAKECLALMKTSKEKFKEIKDAVKTLHSYETPELIALPIKDGLQPYLDWIETSLQ